MQQFLEPISVNTNGSKLTLHRSHLISNAMYQNTLHELIKREISSILCITLTNLEYLTHTVR